MEHEDSRTGPQPASDRPSLRRAYEALGGTAGAYGRSVADGAASREARVEQVEMDDLEVVWLPHKEIGKFLHSAIVSRWWGEVGGMFARHPDKVQPWRGNNGVRYLPGANVASQDRDRNIELSAEWMAEKVDEGWEPLAFIHSHPNEDQAPSRTDFDRFPYWMVHTCFVWYMDAKYITQYWQPENDTRRWVRRALAAHEQGLGITVKGGL